MAHVMCRVHREAAACRWRLYPTPFLLPPPGTWAGLPDVQQLPGNPELEKHRQRRGSGNPEEPGALAALPIPFSCLYITGEK